MKYLLGYLNKTISHTVLWELVVGISDYLYFLHFIDKTIC